MSGSNMIKRAGARIAELLEALDHAFNFDPVQEQWSRIATLETRVADLEAAARPRARE